jgi:hypothetical protein
LILFFISVHCSTLFVLCDLGSSAPELHQLPRLLILCPRERHQQPPDQLGAAASETETTADHGGGGQVLTVSSRGTVWFGGGAGKIYQE